ncbi:MAG: YggT family protein [Thermotaleaceae bacterium]
MWQLRQSVDYFFQVMNYLIIARIIMSWIRINPYGTVGRILIQITEPILGPFRNLSMRFGIGGGYIDFSPILAVFALNILRTVIMNML